jgi:alkaline phosphatase D
MSLPVKKTVALLVPILICAFGHAQIIAGPMLGQVELRDVKLWLEVAPAVKDVRVSYAVAGAPATAKTIRYKGELGNEFNPLQFHIGGLEPNTTYHYQFLVDGKSAKQKGTFTTKELWQYRKPAPDFSFLTGSCAYFNNPQYDRPGKPYGGDSSIFEAMAKEKSQFMIWLGDNWYTREVDYYSSWGLWSRASSDRRSPVLQNFLKSMSHYATWDDHDFGPNDMGGSYILKEESKKVFDAYWANPSSGHRGEGVYSMFTHGDVDFFLCDARWWRSSDDMKDSLNGRPNAEKTMLGRQQMEWLKNSLLQSRATFKIIVLGSQVLNPLSPYDKLAAFPVEYAELTGFLGANRVNGVLFFSGDRHHSEVIRINRPGTYPLHDITVSSLTAGASDFSPAEKESPYRVFGLVQNNYGRVSIRGKRGERVLSVEFMGTKGEKLGEWSVGETALKTPQ